MSGGGKSVLKGRMGSSVAVQTKNIDPEKITEMENTLEQLQQKASESRQKQIKLEDQVKTLQTQLTTIKIDLEKNTVQSQVYTEIYLIWYFF